MICGGEQVITTCGQSILFTCYCPGKCPWGLDITSIDIIQWIQRCERAMYTKLAKQRSAVNMEHLHNLAILWGQLHQLIQTVFEMSLIPAKASAYL